MSSTISDSIRITIGASAVPLTTTTYETPLYYTITDGTNGDDVITAAAGAHYVFGNAGNDTLSNQLSGAILVGGAGNDRFVLHNNSTVASWLDGSILDFAKGSDIIDLSNFNVRFSDLTISNQDSGGTITDNYALITNEAASLRISVAGSGLSRLSESDFILNSSGITDVEDGIHVANGTTGNDLLLGSYLPNILRGLDGNDTLYGDGAIAVATGSNDTLYGGGGNDSLYGNGGNDVIYGGNGIADSTDGHDFIAGGIGSDTLYGNSGNDTLYGGGSAAHPGDQADLIYGGKGADYILGNGGNDTLYGGGAVADPDDQSDTIYGGLGDDYILGNGGNDWLYGQEGNDTLHGGAGDDVYVFSANYGNDVIAHFEGAGQAGGDSILIDDPNAATLIPQILAAIEYRNGNAYVYDTDGNSVTILNIAAGSLSAADFIFSA